MEHFSKTRFYTMFNGSFFYKGSQVIINSLVRDRINLRGKYRYQLQVFLPVTPNKKDDNRCNCSKNNKQPSCILLYKRSVLTYSIFHIMVQPEGNPHHRRVNNSFYGFICFNTQ